MQQDIHTIIIGAGISGMAAANDIAKKGHLVLVLQVNDYIGGRTKTIPVKLINGVDFQFDQGASWIHQSSSQHPITKLSKKIKGFNGVQTLDDNIINFDEKGQDVSQEVLEEFEKYQKIVEGLQNFEVLSVHQAIKKSNPAKLSNKFFMYNVSTDIQFQTSASIKQLSSQHGQDDEKVTENGKQILITSGYQSFPQSLSQHTHIKVLCNHQVVEIAYDGHYNLVRCLSGQVFKGINIIISIPIGALKSSSIKFIPALPNWKRQAIDSIRFGNVCKVLIILKQIQVNRQQHYFGLIPNDTQQRGLATYYLNLTSLTGLPALMTFGLGPNADQLQSMPQQHLKQLISSRLKIFIDPSITSNDFQIKRTSWRSNPYFRGTYSYSGITTKPQHWENMSRPIFERKLYFCGEHTHSLYRGTVHGAYLSGKYAAKDILDEIQEGDWIYRGVIEEKQRQEKEKGEGKRKKKGEEDQGESSSSSDEE